MKRPGIVSTLVLALALAGCDEDAASPAPARSKVEVLQILATEFGLNIKDTAGVDDLRCLQDMHPENIGTQLGYRDQRFTPAQLVAMEFVACGPDRARKGAATSIGQAYSLNTLPGLSAIDLQPLVERASAALDRAPRGS